MRFRSLIAGVVAAASATAPVLMSSPAGAAGCGTDAEIGRQVAAFVHGLRDDVRSADARAAVRGAFVESVQAARGEKAQTPAERRALGEQISALAQQLNEAPGRVERKALIAQIHALQEQKRQDRVSASDVRELTADVRAVKRAVIARADTRREDRQVAAFVRGLIAQFDC